MKIEGRSFAITGGLGSIGGATAKLIVEKGGIAIEAGEERIKTFKDSARYVYEHTDIADQTTFEASIQRALTKVPKGSLFGAVHCAAVNPNCPWPVKMSDKIKDFATCLRVNALGTFTVDAIVADAINSQYPAFEDAFHPRVEEERGCIINLASVVASNTPARCLTYGPSKTCVLGITNAAADFLSVCGIRVNSVAPALVYSRLMNEGGRVEFFKDELQAQSMFPRRFTEPEEISHAIVFLLENSMMNAFHLKCDAGWRMITDWAGNVDREQGFFIESTFPDNSPKTFAYR